MKTKYPKDFYTSDLDPSMQLLQLHRINTIRFLQFTTGETLTPEEVDAAWNDFKEQNFHKGLFFKNISRLINYFRNYMKQSILKIKI